MEDEILETHDLIQDVYQYLKSGCYPQILQDVNRKRIIHKKALRFVLNDGKLYYKQKRNRVRRNQMSCITNNYVSYFL